MTTRSMGEAIDLALMATDPARLEKPEGSEPTMTPGVFYHGSPYTNLAELKSQQELGEGEGRAGVYFSQIPAYSGLYIDIQSGVGGRIYTAELVTKNAYFVPDGFWKECGAFDNHELAKSLCAEISAQGYDCIVTTQVLGLIWEAIVFDKSAIRLRPVHPVDPIPPRVFYAVDGAQPPEYATDRALLYHSRSRALEVAGNGAAPRMVAASAWSPTYCDQAAWRGMDFEMLREFCTDCLVDPETGDALLLDPSLILPLSREQRRAIKANQGRASVKPKATTTAPLAGVQTLSDFGVYSAPKPGGSNPGAIYTDGDGVEWLVKGSNAASVQDAKTVADRSMNEVLAAKLMLAAGAGAPEMKLVDLEGRHNGGIGVASKMIDGLEPFSIDNPSHLAAARNDFAVHAWLANYDALGAGFENMAISDGKALCIDTGGALLFRAQGARKDLSRTGGALHPSAPEFESMRATTEEQVEVYGSMTASELKSSAEKLEALSDGTIKSLVKAHGPGGPAFQDRLAQNLIRRKRAILAKAG